MTIDAEMKRAMTARQYADYQTYISVCNDTPEAAYRKATAKKVKVPLYVPKHGRRRAERMPMLEEMRDEAYRRNAERRSVKRTEAELGAAMARLVKSEGHKEQHPLIGMAMCGTGGTYVDQMVDKIVAQLEVHGSGTFRDLMRWTGSTEYRIKNYIAAGLKKNKIKRIGFAPSEVRSRQNVAVYGVAND